MENDFKARFSQYYYKEPKYKTLRCDKREISPVISPYFKSQKRHDNTQKQHTSSKTSSTLSTSPTTSLTSSLLLTSSRKSSTVQIFKLIDRKAIDRIISSSSAAVSSTSTSSSSILGKYLRMFHEYLQHLQKQQEIDFSEDDEFWTFLLQLCYLYFTFDRFNDFKIPLNDVWKFLGFSTLQHTIASLIRSFEPNIDYRFESIANEYVLCINAVKEFLLISTPPARQHQIRRIVRKIEELNDQMKMENQTKVIELAETRKRLLDEKEREIQNIVGKTYEEINKEEEVYVLKDNDDGIFKVGSTGNFSKRFKAAKTSNSKVESVFTFKCSNAERVERAVHEILQRYRTNAKHEFFKCDLEYIKTVIVIIATTFDTLKSSYEKIDQHELIEHHIENLRNAGIPY